MNPFVTTAIGSLPFTDPDQAVELNLQYLDIPCWPQLPRLSFLENMYAQFCEGFPGIVIDEFRKKIYVNEDFSQQEKFFQAVVDNDYEYFKISENYARGLYAFVKKAKRKKIIKGQITGPVSFGLSITQENGKAIFYNEQLREIVIKHLSMKAIWQYRFLKQIAPEVVIFIDEPYLSSIGSGFLTISETDIQNSLSEVVNIL
ncbi:MAG TPA: methionine synthase, partial [Candidatus Omnitrophica bacterium]|nr:methionine synthase [Candidatus Omnitrophota bacterium]